MSPSADSPGSVDADTDLPISQFLTYRLVRVQARLNAQAGSLLRETCGITLTQWRILSQIGALGATTAKAVAQNADMDKGLISRNLKTLVESGLVLVSPDDRDNRVQHLKLTAQGRAVFDRMLPIMQRRQRKLRDSLTEDEFATLHSALDKLERAAEDTLLP